MGNLISRLPVFPLFDIFVSSRANNKLWTVEVTSPRWQHSSSWFHSRSQEKQLAAIHGQDTNERILEPYGEVSPEPMDPSVGKESPRGTYSSPNTVGHFLGVPILVWPPGVCRGICGAPSVGFWLWWRMGYGLVTTSTWIEADRVLPCRSQTVAQPALCSSAEPSRWCSPARVKAAWPCLTRRASKNTWKLCSPYRKQSREHLPTQRAGLCFKAPDGSSVVLILGLAVGSTRLSISHKSTTSWSPSGRALHNIQGVAEPSLACIPHKTGSLMGYTTMNWWNNHGGTHIQLQ